MIAQLLSDSLQYGDIWIAINGNSMIPFLEDGTQVLVCAKRPFFPGDILVYKQNNELISHRLIRFFKNNGEDIFYQTKPDNGHCLDNPVSIKDVYGKIIAVKKNNKIIRLDTIPAKIKASVLWFFSSLGLLFHKYAV